MWWDFCPLIQILQVLQIPRLNAVASCLTFFDIIALLEHFKPFFVNLQLMSSAKHFDVSLSILIHNNIYSQGYCQSSALEHINCMLFIQWFQFVCFQIPSCIRILFFSIRDRFIDTKYFSIDLSQTCVVVCAKCFEEINKILSRKCFKTTQFEIYVLYQINGNLLYFCVMVKQLHIKG